MAAHLDLVHLRRHALPAHFLPVFPPCANAAVAVPAATVNARPRLLAA